MKTKSYSVDFGGRELVAEFSDLAEHANGSVLLRYGETVILVTAVMGEEKPGASYFPLSVEFEEKHYAAGQILGSRFVRREGRPTDEAVLSARIVDRTIRPLFDQRIRFDVQVVISVLALGEDDPDVLGVIGASLALSTSDIPWGGPVGAVRIGKRVGSDALDINPTYIERQEEQLEYEVLACGKGGNVNMIETAGNEVDEATIVSALERSVESNTALEEFQKQIVAEIGKAKQVLTLPEIPNEMRTLFEKEIAPKLTETLFSGEDGKSRLHTLKNEWLALAGETLEDANLEQAGDLFEEAVDAEIHRGAIEEKRRADGRGMDDLRPLFAKAGGISPALHGSGIFYRGGTHIFTALTLGGPEDTMILDTMEEQDTQKRFMHHYNFPPFSVGEAGRVGGFNRRMIGHGALAEKALKPVIPKKENFPYTIRLVSETMSSNGSSSMGSATAGTIALMDGGVPITRPVAGIASGLMMKSPTEYALLTDIQGPEDEHGDMDFKVAGTREGVTAIQMDVKVDGIPVSILAESLEKAKAARLKILETIEAEITTPRPDISPRAPKIVVMTIQPEQIGLVIGSGGKTINGIKEATGVEEISIEEDGTIYITGRADAPEKAMEQITEIVRTYEIGEKLVVEITRIAPFGAFARINSHTEGLIHVSEIAPFRIENVEDALSLGEEVPVVVTKIEDGKIGLSIKKADPDFAKNKGLSPGEHPGS